MPSCSDDNPRNRVRSTGPDAEDPPDPPRHLGRDPFLDGVAECSGQALQDRSRDREQQRGRHRFVDAEADRFTPAALGGRRLGVLPEVGGDVLEERKLLRCHGVSHRPREGGRQVSSDLVCGRHGSAHRSSHRKLWNTVRNPDGKDPAGRSAQFQPICTKMGDGRRTQLVGATNSLGFILAWTCPRWSAGCCYRHGGAVRSAFGATIPRPLREANRSRAWP